MGDKFRSAIEATVNAVAAKHLNLISRGKTPGDFGKDVANALSQRLTAPACAMRKTDVGPVMIFDPAVLCHKTAGQLRANGLVLANAIPDIAKVVREPDGSLVFAWQAMNVVVEEDDQQPRQP